MSLWLPSFHDSSLVLPRRERSALHRRANALMLRSPKAILLACAIILLPGFLFFAGWRLLWTSAGSMEPEVFVRERGWILLFGLGCLLLFPVIQYLALMQAMNRIYAPFVRRALRDRGTPVCLRCGHLLAAEARLCPECGAGASEAPEVIASSR